MKISEKNRGDCKLSELEDGTVFQSCGAFFIRGWYVKAEEEYMVTDLNDGEQCRFAGELLVTPYPNAILLLEGE